MRVLQRVLDAIAAHARHDSPQECCGLLIGDDCSIFEAVPVHNAALDPLDSSAGAATITSCPARAAAAASECRPGLSKPSSLVTMIRMLPSVTNRVLSGTRQAKPAVVIGP